MEGAEFIARLHAEQLSYQEQKARCEDFLRENPGDPAVVPHLKLVTSFLEMIAEKDAQIAKQETVIAKQETVIVNRSLEAVKTNFPALNDTTLSLPYYPENHCHADIVPNNRMAGILGGIEREFLNQDSSFWKAPFVEEGGNCDSESEAQHLVVCLLKAVLKGLNLDEIVEISQNRTLAGAECDVLLVYKPNRLPFAVIEVKKPANSELGRTLVFEGRPIEDATEDGKEVLTGNRVAGEVFAEMKAIQLFGSSTVTGMISTGNQWRIVGLLNDDQNSEILSNFKKLLSEQRLKSEDGALALNNTTNSEVSPEERGVLSFEEDVELADATIWAGEIVPSHEGVDTNDLVNMVKQSGEQIISQLVLFVVKACSDLSVFLDHGGPEKSIKVRPKMPCRILTKQGTRDHKTQDGVFAFGSITLPNLNLHTFTPANLKYFYVIQHLGMGEYGNVCLGTSSTGGSCCAIKFYHEKSRRKQFAKAECANWEKVYGKISGFRMPFILEVAGGDCLVMPYLHPIPENERLELLDNGVIKTTLETFAKSGFIHTDIKWRHFRQWKTDDQENDRVFLVDFGNESLHKEKKSSAIATWVGNSIETLTRSRCLCTV